MVGMAATVVALVVWQWRGWSSAPDPKGTLTQDQAKGLLTRAEGLEYTETVNGMPRYRIHAKENLAFEGGRSEWRGEVELQLFPAAEKEGEVPEPTLITGRKLIALKSLSGAQGAYEEIRLRGKVHGILPDGPELDSKELDLQPDSEEVSTDTGVQLHYAGLLISAESMRYDTKVRRVKIWGGLRLSADPAAAAGQVPVGLAGQSELLTYDPELSGLLLEGTPSVEMPDAAITGDLLVLEVDRDSSRLRSIQARDEGKVTWLSSAASGEQTLQAGRVTIELGDDLEPRIVRSLAVESVRPVMQMGDAGELSAARIDLHLQEDGAGEVVASGNVLWVSGDTSMGVEELRSDSLNLSMGKEGLEAVDGEGSVEAKLPDEQGHGAAFFGPQVNMGWQQGELQSGQWLQGVRYKSGGRTLEAASGRYEPSPKSWIMDGTPRPRLEDDQYEMEADRIEVAVGGGLAATGGVEANLRGDRVAAIAPMFGGASSVSVGASRFAVSAAGGLEFKDGARLWQGRQVLQAESITFSDDASSLRASGRVLVTLDSSAGTAPSGGENEATRQENDAAAPGLMTLTGGELLVEGSPLQMRLAEGAELDDGSRQIRGTNVIVEFEEESGWRSIEVVGEVSMTDPEGYAEGERLLYDPRTGVVTVLGTRTSPATFVNQRGVDIRDPKGLRLQWTDADLVVTALQQGQTQTIHKGSS